MGTSTVSNKKRSKAAKSALAIALAFLLALGGTFATFYGTQMWTNVGARTTSENPGGRVHDDFGNRVEDAATGKVTFDKNVYAESFVDHHSEGEYLVARIRLKNYAEINTDANNPGHVGAESRTQGTYGDVGSYATVTYDVANGFQPNLTFGAASQPDFAVDITGGAADGRYNYIPTFNKVMEGVGATDVDVRGKYPDYSGYPEVVINGRQNAEYTQAACYNNDEQREETHLVKLTVPGYRGVTTLTDWNSKPDGEKDNWWVYDEAAADPSGDGGWFYWSSPLSPDSATGLLIDGLEVAGDDLDWYYALNVEGEFITVEGTPRDSDAAGWYWCKNDGGVTKRVPSQGVSDLIDFVQDPSKNYKARVAMAIDGATVLKDSTTVDANGTYTEALVDLSETEGGVTKGEEVYVLYKDTKNRKALVITTYLTRKWGDGGTGFGPFDNRGEHDWDKSQAKDWCEDTYYAWLPADLQKMIPEVTVEYDGPTDAEGNRAYTSSGHVFFMSRGDNNTVSEDVTGNHDSTVANTLLFKNQLQSRATFKGETQAQCYWHRSSCLIPSESIHYVSGTYTSGNVCNIWPSTCALWGHTVANVGARPMFWINY